MHRRHRLLWCSGEFLTWDLSPGGVDLVSIWFLWDELHIAFASKGLLDTQQPTDALFVKCCPPLSSKRPRANPSCNSPLSDSDRGEFNLDLSRGGFFSGMLLCNHNMRLALEARDGTLQACPPWSVSRQTKHCNIARFLVLSQISSPGGVDLVSIWFLWDELHIAFASKGLLETQQPTDALFVKCCLPLS